MTRKENFLRAIYRQDPEWVPYGLDDAVRMIYPPVCERPKNAGKDVFGCLWVYEEKAQGGTYPANHDFVITDISDWKNQLHIPDVNECDWSAVRAAAEAIDRDQYLVEGFIEMGLFERSYLLLGMEEALMAYYTDEEYMYELCGAIADYKIAFLERYYEETKMDMLWYGDDWGTQSNLFMAPEIWRRVIKPHTARIYKRAKELGIIINQHSCGKIDSIVGDLVEMGVDLWNNCQPCNDLVGLKKKYGDKMCFFGGIDSQFVLDNPLATPEDVIKETRRRIDDMALPHGGYIAGPSHSVPYNPEKLEAMVSTIRNYGREIYSRNK